jgi:hypothetical protein
MSAYFFAPDFSAQARQWMIPRMLQITQRNVPQDTHGYPSEARSSLPQARQTIESFS